MIGADTQNTPYTLLFDYMEQGSLTTLLRDGRELLTKESNPQSLSLTMLADYIQQILKGMEFLAAHHIAHGSLRGSAKFLI
jgi:serine/threonine protein kinase